MVRDAAALEGLASPSTANASRATKSLVASLPTGQLTVEKVVIETGVGANSAGLEVTVTSPANGSTTITVGLLGEVGDAALDSPDWNVADPKS